MGELREKMMADLVLARYSPRTVGCIRDLWGHEPVPCGRGRHLASPVTVQDERPATVVEPKRQQRRDEAHLGLAPVRVAGRWRRSSRSTADEGFKLGEVAVQV